MQKCRLLVLCTASNKMIIDDLEVGNAFSTVLRVPPLSRGEHICTALETVPDLFTDAQMSDIRAKLADKRCACSRQGWLRTRCAALRCAGGDQRSAAQRAEFCSARIFALSTQKKNTSVSILES